MLPPSAVALIGWAVGGRRLDIQVSVSPPMAAVLLTARPFWGAFRAHALIRIRYTENGLKTWVNGREQKQKHPPDKLLIRALLRGHKSWLKMHYLRIRGDLGISGEAALSVTTAGALSILLEKGLSFVFTACRPDVLIFPDVTGAAFFLKFTGITELKAAKIIPILWKEGRKNGASHREHDENNDGAAL